MRLTERFQALDAFLSEWEAVWRPNVFAAHDGGWFPGVPDVSRWVEGACDDTRIAPIVDTPGHFAAADDWPAPVQAWYEAARDLCDVPSLPNGPQRVQLRAREMRFLSERKWEQVVRFIEALPETLGRTGALAEWCAGKGHLARTLAISTGLTVTRLERNPTLVAEGDALAAKMNASCPGALVDVLDRSVEAHLTTTTQVLALHACGSLHRRLVRLACEQRIAGIALAPCCYQLGDGVPYAPLSRAGVASSLRFGADALRLSVRGARGDSMRRVRLHERAQAWRIGFDLLRRQVLSADARYRPQPVAPRAWLGGSFRNFCERLAAAIGISLPATAPFARLEREGYRRLARVRRAERVVALFSRPIELWIALDLALALADGGADVRFGTFCSASVTPRNLLIWANR